MEPVGDRIQLESCDHSPSRVARTRRHSSTCFAWTRQTRRHSPTCFARTRQTRRHSPTCFARTRRHSPTNDLFSELHWPSLTLFKSFIEVIFFLRTSLTFPNFIQVVHCCDFFLRTSLTFPNFIQVVHFCDCFDISIVVWSLISIDFSRP